MNSDSCEFTFGKVQEEIEILVRARYSILYIVSWEEERVEACLAEVAARRGKQLVCWSCVRGLYNPADSLSAECRTLVSGSTDPLVALDSVLKRREPAVYLFKDFHAHLTNTTVVRKLRETAQILRSSPKTLVIVSHVQTIPPELEKDITIVDFHLPRLPELGALFDQIVGEVHKAGRLQEVPDEATREQLLHAAQGLTLREAENAIARTLIVRGRLSLDEVQLVLDEKKRAIRKTGILEYIDERKGLDEVGGLEALKDWVRKRLVAFTDQARSFGLPPPKGVLLLGVQGCGKSLCAYAISQLWHLPLLRLDVGRIFSGLIGSSEENIRKAITTAESVAPAVLWIDEIEKAFAGTRGADSDAGTSSRVFGTFLTWLQEKKEPVFVIASANSIANLPPELLRKGRFDEIFFVDLPSQKERREIFDIHLKLRQRDSALFNLDYLSDISDGYSGSEIEQAVIAALYDAFDLGRDLVTEDIAKVLQQTVPLSSTLREEIAYARNWATSRARRASG